MTWRTVGVGIPPLLLAAVGLAHPMTLTAQTSTHWTVLHLALIPVFPLLGVCLWVLLAGERGTVPMIGRIAAFAYVCFYGALDTINGVAVGVLVSTAPAGLTDQRSVLRPVLDVGNTLAWIGSTAFLVAAVITGVLAVRARGRAAVPGAVLMTVAAISFLNSHIYWPRGVLTMIVLGVGFVLLARQRDHRGQRDQLGGPDQSGRSDQLRGSGEYPRSRST